MLSLFLKSFLPLKSLFHFISRVLCGVLWNRLLHHNQIKEKFMESHCYDGDKHIPNICPVQETDTFCVAFFVLTDLTQSPEEWMACLERKEMKVSQQPQHFAQGRKVLRLAREYYSKGWLYEPDWIADKMSDSGLPLRWELCADRIFKIGVSFWFSFMSSSLVRPRLM